VLGGIAHLPSLSDVYLPELLTSNPLYVWGAAVMDGLYTEEELSEAGQFAWHQRFPWFLN
jgi:hypothetical protein